MTAKNAATESKIVKGWLNKKEAAEYIGISKPELNNWILRGLYHRKIGKRFFLKPEKIDEFIDQTGHAEVSISEMVDGVLRR